MVVLLHANEDYRAGNDLARLHDTRTVLKVVPVSATGEQSAVLQILTDKTRVVITDDPERISGPMLTVLQALKLLRFPIVNIEDYLNDLHQPTEASAAPPTQHIASVTGNTLLS